MACNAKRLAGLLGLLMATACGSHLIAAPGSDSGNSAATGGTGDSSEDGASGGTGDPQDNSMQPGATGSPVTNTPPTTFTIPTQHPVLLFSNAATLQAARTWFASKYPGDSFDPDDDASRMAFGYLMNRNVEWGEAAVSWALAGLGRNLFTETPYFREVVYGVIYTTTEQATSLVTAPGDTSFQIFSFQDDEFFKDGGSAEKASLGDFMQTAATLFASSQIGKHARTWVDRVDPPRSPWIRALGESTASAPFDTLPLDYYMPGPQFFYTRSRWTGGTSILMQMGLPDTGHAHQDWGTFQISRKGKWLSHETYGYSDTIAGFAGVGTVESNDHLAHNSLLFEGIGRPGIGMDGDGSPLVQRIASSPGVSYAAVDLSQSYRDHGSHYVANGKLRDDNPHSGSVVRELILARDLDAIVTVDRMVSVAFDRGVVAGVTNAVSTAEAVRKTFVMHFETNPTVEANTSGNHALLATNGDQALRVKTLAPDEVSLLVVNEHSNGASIGQYRLEVTASGAAATTFIHVLEAKDTAQSDLTATLTQDVSSYTVTLRRTGPGVGTGTAIIKVSKGNAVGCVAYGFTSSTSTLPVPGPLADHVQKLSLTDLGPEWAATGPVCSF